MQEGTEGKALRESLPYYPMTERQGNPQGFSMNNGSREQVQQASISHAGPGVTQPSSVIDREGYWMPALEGIPRASTS